MNLKTRYIILGVLVVIIVGSVVILEARKAETDSGSSVEEVVVTQEEATASAQERIAQKKEQYEPAKEITTPNAFINTEGVRINDLIGEKIVLVDFWTYSCINCQRTLPYLNSWYEKYADDGLEIIGIHTPEFEFEKDLTNVQRAVDKFNIAYPVVLDNDYSTWRAYRNQYWPRKYLIGPDGFIIYDHIGEGAYKETEQQIVAALNDLRRIQGEGQIMLDTTPPEGVDTVDFSRVRTPETYLGSKRIKYLENLPRQSCLGRECSYNLPQNIALNTFALGGTWRIEEENAVLTGGEGTIAIGFSASKVNLVAGSITGKPVRAEIYLDGTLVNDARGAALSDNGIVEFSQEELYNLIDLQGEYGQHLLEIRILDPGFSGFAFTFG